MKRICNFLYCTSPMYSPARRGAASISEGRPAHSACNDALQVDRVALLFLSRGALHHEATWDAWLAGAAGALPLQATQVRLESPKS